jgi:GNAT superfamily N-acetyltransferase
MMQDTHEDTHRSHRSLATVVAPRLRAGGAADRELVGVFVARLSPASAYARFLTGASPVPSARLLSALLPERPHGGAILGFLGDELVGHALWVRTADLSVAEIAVVVGDRHQRRGIGTALASAVIEDLAAHGVTDVEAFSLSGNRAVARMVAREAPGARRELDGPTSTWTFPARARGGALPQTA